MVHAVPEQKKFVGGIVARGYFAADPISKLISVALRELFVDVKVDGLAFLLIFAVLGHVGAVLVFLISVFLCELCHSYEICHHYSIDSFC